MGSQTPVFKVPYPVGSDRVMDGDNAMQAIADRVEALANPAWKALPVAAGWGPLAGAQAPEYGKVWGFLCVRGMVAAVTGATTVVATLPAGFVVAARQFLPTVYWTGVGLSASEFTLETDGRILTSWTPANGQNFPLVFPPLWVGP
jgi:hypothetical protein